MDNLVNTVPQTYKKVIVETSTSNVCIGKWCRCFENLVLNF